VTFVPPAVSPHIRSRPARGTTDSYRGGYVGRDLFPCVDNCQAAAKPEWSQHCKTACSDPWTLRKDTFSSAPEISALLYSCTVT